jgi:SAM-dependent methyltransferase
MANVIDCGSKNINGDNRSLFRRNLYNWAGMNSYTGIDIVYGPNVDIVKDVHLALPLISTNPRRYLSKARSNKSVWPIDIVISTEMLEHDMYWEKSLKEMYNILRPGGLLLITAGGEGREEHGTYTHQPFASPGTLDYYENISTQMFRSVLPMDLFENRILRQTSGDFQFAGIKVKKT